jgi:hypothetical protein
MTFTHAFVRLFAVGLAVTLAGHASGTTFEKAISPVFSYTEDVEQTSDGGYVVGANFCGSTCYIALVAKLDSIGNLQWQKQYQPSGGRSQVYALKQTSDGGYIWAGDLENSNCECAIVVKLDSSGNVQWQKTYGVVANATDIRQTVDGGYVVGGVTPPSPSGIVHAWIAKLDSSGSAQWQKVLGSSQSVTANSVIQTAGGGYALAGYANTNVVVAKLDSSGNVKWQTLYTSPSTYGAANGIVQTSDGGYIVAGSSDISPQLALALKLSSGGKVQWAKTYDVSGAASQFNSVRQTTDGGYAFSGYFYTGGYNGWIVKTDSSGNVQWQKAYGNPNSAAIFQKIGLTGDGGLVAAGWTLEFNNQNEAYIVKTDSGGNVNNCSDVQVTAAATASLREASSPARLSISAPANIAGSGPLSPSSTSLTLTTECSGN